MRACLFVILIFPVLLYGQSKFDGNIYYGKRHGRINKLLIGDTTYTYSYSDSTCNLYIDHQGIATSISYIQSKERLYVEDNSYKINIFYDIANNQTVVGLMSFNYDTISVNYDSTNALNLFILSHDSQKFRFTIGRDSWDNPIDLTGSEIDSNTKSMFYNYIYEYNYKYGLWNIDNIIRSHDYYNTIFQELILPVGWSHVKFRRIWHKRLRHANWGYPDETTISYSPELGINVSNIRQRNDSSNTTSWGKSALGIQAGVSFRLPILNKTWITTSLLFSTKGRKGGIENSFAPDESTTLNYIEVPVSIQYKILDVFGAKLYGSLGAYIAYGISGNYSDMDVEIGNDESLISPIDLGARCDISCYTLPGLFIRGSYEIGLSNIYQGSSNVTLNNYNTSISIGFSFGGH